MRTLKCAALSLGLLTVAGLAAPTLITGPALEAQAAPPCEVQCKKEFRACQRICGQPNVNCLVACETVLDICLANCGAITE